MARWGTTAPAASPKAASIPGDESSPVTNPAGGTSASEAAPPPHPTSSTEPPSGNAASALRRDGVSSGIGAGANNAGGNPHGDSGAWAMISSGMAQAASCSAQVTG